MKRILATLLILTNIACSAQVDYSVDSMKVVNAEWSVDTLEGFYLKRYHFGDGALFCSAQNLCIIEIPAKSHRKLAFTYDTILTSVFYRWMMLLCCVT